MGQARSLYLISRRNNESNSWSPVSLIIRVHRPLLSRVMSKVKTTPGNNSQLLTHSQDQPLKVGTLSSQQKAFSDFQCMIVVEIRTETSRKKLE